MKTSTYSPADSVATQQNPSFMWIVLIFIAALLPRVIDLDLFLAHDETLLWEWSHKFFFSLLTGDFEGTIVGPGNPSIIPMWAQAATMSVQYGWAWLNGVNVEALAEWPAFQSHLVFSELPLRRLPVSLLNAVSVTAIWWLCYRLFGRKLALIAAILLILDPFWLSDSRTVRGEGILSGLVTVTLLAFILFWHSQRWRYLILSGTVMGLALLTKMSSVSLLPMAGIIAAVYVWQRPRLTMRVRLHKVIVPVLIWGGVALLTFWALWPAMWVAPLAALNYLWNFAYNVGVEGRTNYFFGKLYSTELLPLYYPVVFILRVTPVALTGIVAFVILLAGILWTKLRNNGQSLSQVWPTIWPDFSCHPAPSPTPLLLIAIYPVLFGVFMTVGVLKRDWYFMPAFPSLDIVAAAGLAWAGQSLWQRFWPRMSASRVWLGGVGLVLLFQAWFSLASHPFYFTYWNPMVLGNRWAATAIMLGWDLDLSMGAQYLNSKPDSQNLIVATSIKRSFEEIFTGTTKRWTINSDWIQADYLVVRLVHLQLKKHEPWELNYLRHLNLEHVVNINGVDYLWIYQAPGAEYFPVPPSKLVGKGTLFGYDISPNEISVGETAHLDLYWLNQGVTDQDAFFVRLADAGGDVWAETAVKTPAEFKKLNIEEVMTESFADLEIPAGTPPGRYFLQMDIYDQLTREVVGSFSLPEDGRFIEVLPARQQLKPPAITHPLNQSFASDIMLLGFDAATETLSLQNNNNQITFYWQARNNIPQDLVMGLQLLDHQDSEVAYWLGRPVKSGYPTNQWHPGEIVRDPWNLDLPSEVLPGDYTLRLTLYDSAGSTPVGSTDLGPVTVVDRRRLFELPPVQQTIDARVGDSIHLMGYNLFEQPLTGGARFKLTLFWQTDRPFSEDYTVFTQVLDPHGLVVGQHDGMPDEGKLPTSTWQPGEIVADYHLLDFPTVTDGDYRLIVGMYNPLTGERLPVAAPSDVVRTDNFLQIYTVSVQATE